MDKIETTNEINRILSEIELDERIKPMIKLFFIGKARLGTLSTEQIKSQIDILCSRIRNIEFTTSDKIIVAYEAKAGVLTINKQLFIDKKSDEIILPVFMKFEEALNQDNQNSYGNYIENFIKAGRIAKEISSPMSERLYRLYEMAEYCYGDIEHKIQELISDSLLENVCSKYNSALNNMIVSGIDNRNALLDGVRLFHNEIFNDEAFDNPDFEGPYKNEEYQKKASKILACVNIIKPMKYANYFSNIMEMDALQLQSLKRNLLLFTGCTEKMVETEKSQKYMGESRISTILEAAIEVKPQELTEEFIINRIQEIIDRKPEWDNRVKHLVIPFFVRSQKIYNWNMDEFQERVNQLDFKIDEIVFEDLENITNMGSTAMNKIKLNSRVFLDKNEKIKWPVTQTMFHELGHVTDEYQREGVKSREMLQSPLSGGQFYEWTNTVFERAIVGNKFYKKNDAMQLSEAGYEELAPLGSMFACALGVPEIEFAKIKDKGRDYETMLFEQILPNEMDILQKVMDNFNKYKLSVSYSLERKRNNQNVLNELYSTCLEIMKKRIENELQTGNIEDLEQYKKYQMFYLKKMNFNFKNATNFNGFRFSRIPIIHDIGFCDEKISKKDLLQIAQEHISLTDFGFDNSTLDQYSKAMTVSDNKKSFRKRVKVHNSQMDNGNKTLDRKERNKSSKDEEPEK